VTIACAASSSSCSSTLASSSAAISGRSLARRPAFSASSSHLTHTGAARFSRSGALQTRAFFGKMFKQDPSENTRKKYQDRVDAINALEPSLQALSDEQLRAKTDEFKARVKGGESLDALLPEAFAVSEVFFRWRAR
jgi:preprotein translocase subunit SecA